MGPLDYNRIRNTSSSYDRTSCSDGDRSIVVVAAAEAASIDCVVASL